MIKKKEPDILSSEQDLDNRNRQLNVSKKAPDSRKRNLLKNNKYSGIKNPFRDPILDHSAKLVENFRQRHVDTRPQDLDEEKENKNRIHCDEFLEQYTISLPLCLFNEFNDLATQKNTSFAAIILELNLLAEIDGISLKYQPHKRKGITTRVRFPEKTHKTKVNLPQSYSSAFRNAADECGLALSGMISEAIMRAYKRCNSKMELDEVSPIRTQT